MTSPYNLLVSFPFSLLFFYSFTVLLILTSFVVNFSNSRLFFRFPFLYFHSFPSYSLTGSSIPSSFGFFYFCTTVSFLPKSYFFLRILLLFQILLLLSYLYFGPNSSDNFHVSLIFLSFLFSSSSFSFLPPFIPSFLFLPFFFPSLFFVTSSPLLPSPLLF